MIAPLLRVYLLSLSYWNQKPEKQYEKPLEFAANSRRVGVGIENNRSHIFYAFFKLKGGKEEKRFKALSGVSRILV